MITLLLQAASRLTSLRQLAEAQWNFHADNYLGLLPKSQAMIFTPISKQISEMSSARRRPMLLALAHRQSTL
jgi:hypothetical protein